MPKIDDIDVKAMKAKLLEWRDEIDRLREQSAESREAVELDQTRQGRLSRQDALMQQEMAKETERRRGMDRQRIEAALKRIDDDEYGYCLGCDEVIAVKRLALDPAVASCIKCASQAGG